MASQGKLQERRSVRSFAIGTSAVFTGGTQAEPPHPAPSAAVLRAALGWALAITGALAGSLSCCDEEVQLDTLSGDATAPLPSITAGPRHAAAAARLPFAAEDPRSRASALPTAAGLAGAARRYVDTLQILHRERPLALLHLHFGSLQEQLVARRHHPTVSRGVGLRLRRPALRMRVLQATRRDMLLHGESDALSQLESDIDKVSTTPYPLVLKGAFGFPDVEVAAAVHFSSERAQLPFVAFDCASCAHNMVEALEDAWHRAEGGTLLLSRVDLVDETMQRHLLRLVRPARERRDAIRIIASTPRCLAELESMGTLSRLLRSELDLLQVEIPTVRDRLQDLRPLLEHSIACHTRGEAKRLSADVWHACMQHAWLENEAELERFAIRIAVLAETAEVGMAEVHRLAPWIVPATRGGSAAEANGTQADPNDAAQGSATHAEPEPSTQVHLPSHAAQPLPVAPSSDEGGIATPEMPLVADDAPLDDRSVQRLNGTLHLLVQQLVAQDFTSTTGLGVGMQRALRFVGTSFQGEISLQQLARESYISASHLSFLFKRDLGIPFKTLLAAVRIEKARQLLLGNRHQSITEICLDSGFGDLSHFERTFKRLIGSSPRDFRRRMVQQSGVEPMLHAAIATPASAVSRRLS